MVRFLQPIKGEKSQNLLFLLNREMKDLIFELSLDEQVACISNTIMNCVDTFFPAKPMKNHSKSNEWFANNIKNAIHKRNSLFQK